MSEPHQLVEQVVSRSERCFARLGDKATTGPGVRSRATQQNCTGRERISGEEGGGGNAPTSLLSLVVLAPKLGRHGREAALSSHFL